MSDGKNPWLVSILDRPPVSGTIEEATFEGGMVGNPWLWVRFEEAAGPEAWVGCFRNGWRGFDSVQLSSKDEALVVAGGEGYWVSLRERRVRYREDNITATTVVPEAGLVLVADDLRVSLLGMSGVVWRTPRISLDGITFDHCNAARVQGTAEQPYGKPVSFEIDLASGAVFGGWREP